MKSVIANELTCSDTIMATNIGTIIIRTAWGYLGATLKWCGDQEKAFLSLITTPFRGKMYCKTKMESSSKF